MNSENINDSNGNYSNVLNLWHQRLGHLNFDTLRKMRRQGILKINGSLNRSSFCESCILRKIHKEPRATQKILQRNKQTLRVST